MIFQFQGFLFVLKIDPKLVSNGMIDAEGVRKPPDRLLDGSWSGFECSWSALGQLFERLQGRGSTRGSSGGDQAYGL